MSGDRRKITKETGKNMKRLFFWIAMAPAILTVIPAWAHHSMAGFDRTKTIAVTGTVKEFKWANPHAWIDLEVPDAKSGTIDWNVEMTSPSVLIRAGWKSNVLKPGQKVTVMCHPQQSGEPGGLFVSVTLPDGRTLTDKPAGAPDGRGAAPPDDGKK
jgi:hypothetical protein